MHVRSVLWEALQNEVRPRDKPATRRAIGSTPNGTVFPLKQGLNLRDKRPRVKLKIAH
jgi:hypothetical protein